MPLAEKMLKVLYGSTLNIFHAGNLFITMTVSFKIGKNAFTFVQLKQIKSCVI